jgi:hypothetical protein
MVTLFSTSKPFQGHSNIIQRNALKSWKLLHPEAEVILFGDEEGAAEACRDLGIKHEPQVRRNQYGTKYLNYIFDRASEIARHNVLCYANCDIILGEDFGAALRVISSTHREFLIIGRRWDTDITELWDFDQSDWNNRLRSLVLLKGKQNGPSWVDYFCFTRKLYYKKMPPFLIGRNGWDPWLTWFAHNSQVPLIDASQSVIAVHQNHDYVYLNQGAVPLHKDEEAKYNWDLGDGPQWHHYTVKCANECLVHGHLRSNPWAWLGPIHSRIATTIVRVWFSLLNITRPIRHPLGLRRNSSL